jgi:hypothetical protein
MIDVQLAGSKVCSLGLGSMDCNVDMESKNECNGKRNADSMDDQDMGSKWIDRFTIRSMTSGPSEAVLLPLELL